jgi:alanine transaminase
MRSRQLAAHLSRLSRSFHSSIHRQQWDMAGLTLDSINPALLKVEYAVRGELAIKAEAYRVQLAEGSKDLPFDRVISSNIGNPQQKGLDQRPLTFPRQVAALTEYPELIKSATAAFPADAIARAQEILNEVGSIGAYSHSQGIPLIRKHVAAFIQGPPSRLPHMHAC